MNRIIFHSALHWDPDHPIWVYSAITTGWLHVYIMLLTPLYKILFKIMHCLAFLLAISNLQLLVVCISCELLQPHDAPLVPPRNVGFEGVGCPVLNHL